MEKEKNELKKYRFENPARKTIAVTITTRKIYTEFLECPNLDKFNPRSKVLFKDGTPMGYWFGVNMQKIKESKDPLCIEIIKQYNKKKQKERFINMFYSRKCKYDFVAMDNLDKFSANSKLTFRDGTFVIEWFLKNKEDILSSDNEVDIKIKNQYFNYLAFENLKIEFLNASILKFDQYECIRFSTGAIMNLWWDCFSDKILSYTDSVSLEIKRQYDSYLSLINKEEKIKEVLVKKN